MKRVVEKATKITGSKSPELSSATKIHHFTGNFKDSVLEYCREPQGGARVASQLPGSDHAQSLVTGSTTFALLTGAGKVYTWGSGDPFVGLCLGRDEPSDPIAASKLELVNGLSSYKMTKIDADDKSFGALDTDKNFWVWGPRNEPQRTEINGIKNLGISESEFVSLLF